MNKTGGKFESYPVIIILIFVAMIKTIIKHVFENNNYG